jgi:hypothetical protein
LFFELLAEAISAEAAVIEQAEKSGEEGGDGERSRGPTKEAIIEAIAEAVEHR